MAFKRHLFATTSFLSALRFARYEGEGGGGGNEPEPPISESVLKSKTFTYDDLKELRRESANHRLKAKDAETRLAEATAQLEAARGEIKASGEKLTASEKASNERFIRAKLEAAAVKAGMVDTDGIKLLDLSTVKLTADGAVEGVEALMTAAKEAKPYLFGVVTANTSTQQAPPAKPAAGAHVGALSDVEYAAEKARALAS